MTPERLKQIREQFAQAGFRPNQTQAKKVVAELCMEMDKLMAVAEAAKELFYSGMLVTDLHAPDRLIMALKALEKENEPTKN